MVVMLRKDVVWNIGWLVKGEWEGKHADWYTCTDMLMDWLYDFFKLSSCRMKLYIHFHTHTHTHTERERERSILFSNHARLISLVCVELGVYETWKKGPPHPFPIPAYLLFSASSCCPTYITTDIHACIALSIDSLLRLFTVVVAPLDLLPPPILDLLLLLHYDSCVST